VTGSQSRGWLCFKATEEGEEEDGLFEDKRAGDQILWKGGLSLSLSLSLSCFSGAAGFVHSFAALLFSS